MEKWRKLYQKYLLPGVILLVVSGFVAGCGSTNTAGNAVTHEKTVRIAEANVPNIDPGIGSDYSSSVALCNLYDTLVFPKNDGTLSPLLATTWQTSADGLTWTFNLKPGVKFHNGDELTADDVAFSMQRMLTMGQGFAYLFTGVVKSAQAVGKDQVQFTLKKPYGPFLASLVRLYVLDKNQVTANLKQPGQYGTMGDYGADWLHSHDAGSGPYMVGQLKPEESLTAVKFSDYFSGWEANAPESFQIIGTTAAATIRTLMSQRKLEISDEWESSEALKALGAIPGVTVNSAYNGSIFNIMLNTKLSPTDDVHFRKALAYAFDYDTAVSLFPGCKKAQGPVSFVLPGFDANLDQYTYDISKAKEELAKSKYAGKLDQNPVNLTWIAEVPDEEKLALLFQNDVAPLGIKVNITKTPWLTFTNQVAKVDSTPNASIVSISPNYAEAGSELDRYLSSDAGTWEQCEWLKNNKLDADIQNALSTTDTAQRMAKYQAIQTELLNLSPTIWMLDQAENRAYQKDYVVWPAAELVKAGKPTCPVLGYNFYFRNFQVFLDKVPPVS